MELSPEERRRIYEEEKIRIQAQEKAKRKRGCTGCLIFTLIFVFVVLFITFVQYFSCKEPATPSYHTYAPPDTSETQEVERSAKTELITGPDNGYKWRKTSYEARVNLCKDIARRIGKHGWKYYYEAVDAFYKTTDPTILRQPIAVITGMASVMPSEEKQRESITRAALKGRISARDREIHSYLQSRWDFYERRDGHYIPEGHDDIVLSDAARKFSISKEEALKSFRKIEKVRWGTK